VTYIGSVNASSDAKMKLHKNTQSSRINYLKRIKNEGGTPQETFDHGGGGSYYSSIRYAQNPSAGGRKSKIETIDAYIAKNIAKY